MNFLIHTIQERAQEVAASMGHDKLLRLVLQKKKNL